MRLGRWNHGDWFGGGLGRNHRRDGDEATDGGGGWSDSYIALWGSELDYEEIR